MKIKRVITGFLIAGVLMNGAYAYSEKNEDSETGVFEKLGSLLGWIGSDDQSCVKKIKKNKGVVTWDSWFCYHVERYKKASPILKKTKTNVFYSDVFGPLATEKVTETPVCTELRDLNFAILASSHPVYHQRLRAIYQKYKEKVRIADEPLKNILYEKLGEEIKAVLPLYIKEVCSLGVDPDSVGEIRRVRGQMIVSNRIKQDGIFLFSDEIFEQLNQIYLARDIAEGRADRKSKGAESAK